MPINFVSMSAKTIIIIIIKQTATYGTDQTNLQYRCLRQQGICSAQQQKAIIITGWQHSASCVADFASKRRKK